MAGRYEFNIPPASSCTTSTAGEGETFQNSGAQAVTWDPYGPPELVSTTVFADRIELVYRAEARFTLTTSGAICENPPKVWKEIYRAEGSKLVMTKVDGSYSAGYNVPESYNFPEE